MDKTAIVILNYNGVDYLKQFLPLVVKYSGNCDIAVIDNNSNDSSIAFIVENHPGVQLIKLDDNYGFSGGYNKGLEDIKSDNYILLNSDVEVTPGWAVALTDYLDSNRTVAICQPKILSLKNKQQFDYAGAAGGYLDILGYPFCRGRVFNHLEKDLGQYDVSQSIFWAGGACFCIRAKVFKELGGFDEDFFAHMEEIDLCWRSQRAGFKTAYVGNSKVYHVGGGTLSETNPFKTYLNFRNGLQLLVKNSSILDLMWKLPMRIVLDIVATLRFLLLGNWAHAFSVWRAGISFLITLPKTWLKRKQFKAPYEARLISIVLVWEYFVRGKRTFQELSGSR